jgi:hypothetical protein
MPGRMNTLIFTDDLANLCRGASILAAFRIAARGHLGAPGYIFVKKEAKIPPEP